MRLSLLNPLSKTGAVLFLAFSFAGCDDKDTTGETATVTQDDTALPDWQQDNDGDGYTTEQGDCDDADGSVSPGAEEICDGIDNNCDDEIDEGLLEDWYADADADGFGDMNTSEEACDAPSGYVADSTDCDDSNDAVAPGLVEICDGLDNDCDGETDEDSIDTSVYYADGDGDGWGDSDDSQIACEQPLGYVADDGDCDDADAAYYPGAPEDDCTDPNDYNCDGSVGYADDDGDGFAACEECDDTDAAVNPAAVEVCNGIDDDCDGTVDNDDALNASTWYADADADGYGDPLSSTDACEQPTGYVADNTDCDDGESAAYPGNVEICDDIDNDCNGFVDDDALNESDWYADADGDTYGNTDDSVSSCDQPSGYVSDDTDCDDALDTVNPAATEICNDIDDNCDGNIDEDTADDASTWYRDADGDTYGNADLAIAACDQPSGFVSDDTDCDDGVAEVNPAAAEVCDGIDNDCDGVVDNDDAAGTATWYLDDDGDSYGDPAESTEACDQPSGYVADDTDCDDAAADHNPGAVEWCDDDDDDCDGTIDEDGAFDVQTWYADSDADAYGDPAVSDIDCEQPTGYVSDNTDCDDSNADHNPAATEVCDTDDDDCDGSIDEDGAADVSTWYADNDGDNYGAAAFSDIDCYQPEGFVADNTDCDDSNADHNPAATEYCDDDDDDCDGAIDEDGAADVATWYADTDADTYGDPNVSDIDCEQPTGYVADNTDCNDTTPLANPSVGELCDTIDNDCDSDVDEDGASDASTWYADVDADSYGDPLSTDIDCYQPTGYVADNTDCDDESADSYPGLAEWCDDRDNDCDAVTDEEAGDWATWYADSDSDGYGDLSATQESCSSPDGYVADNTDCDDGNADHNPAATELCDSDDDDCDGAIDEDGATDVSTWYADSDGDSYGDASSTDVDCYQPTGYVADNTDCDDASADHNPAATEYCDGDDDDCDSTVDEDGAADASTWYADSDADGYGDPGNTDVACEVPAGHVEDDTDCDDGHSDAYPGADEYCTGYDNDCDAITDEDALDGDYYALDNDSDGWGAEGTLEWGCSGVLNDLDCDDSDASEPMAVVSGDSIQDAIDAAYGCVVVGDGTYYEAIDFGGNEVSVTSENGAGSTIIDASSSGAPAVTFASGEGSDAVLSGFTLVGGEGNLDEDSSSSNTYSDQVVTDYYYTYCGGGLYIDSSSPTLENLVIDSNILPAASVTTVSDTDGSGATYTSEYHYTYSYGGGSCVMNGNPMFDNVDFLSNWADQGGGLYIDEYSVVDSWQGWIYDNGATDGGGVMVDGGSFSMWNMASVWNSATSMGGGLYATDASVSIMNVTFGYEDAPMGGSVYLGGLSTVSVVNSIVYGATDGEGVYAEGTVSYTDLFNNVYANASGNYGGTAAAGTGSISSDPLFVDASNDDWSLDTGSPSIDAGHPDSAYDDPDGTTNDQGGWGGPDAVWD